MGAALRDMPDWPALLDNEGVAAYSGLSEAEIRRHTRAGELIWKAVGPNGAKVCPREMVDTLLRKIWADPKGSLLEDMDFGDGDD